MSLLLSFLTGVLVVATLLPLSRAKVWWVRGLDFPRTQIAALAALVLCLSFVGGLPEDGRGWFWPVVNGSICLYQLIWIWSFTPLHRKEVATAPRESRDARLRILAANVLMSNRRTEDFVALVREQNPDVLLTVETDGWWQTQLAVLQRELPHTLAAPLDNLYGMHLFSRWPLEDPKVQFLIEPDKPSMHTAIALPNGVRVRLVCLHPAPPSPTENSESTERDAELILVARSLAQETRPSVVTGDLNDVAWSRTTRLFRKISRMLDPRVGRGLFNTFHAKFPFLRWPVDHVFHSPHFTLAKLQCLRACGSDHFPVLIELVLSRGGANQPPLEATANDAKEAQEETVAAAVSPSNVHVPRNSSRRVDPTE
jgi:endonuclease/exonuclease/phosphatase (EEP) superfamily protein YafD